MEERRRNVRTELASTLIIQRIGGQLVNETCEIKVVDVSKTGVGFSCNRPLEIGAVYEANLRIWTQEVLHSLIEIVRIEKRARDYVYGGIFVGMPESVASRIEIYHTVESLKTDK